MDENKQVEIPSIMDELKKIADFVETRTKELSLSEYAFITAPRGSIYMHTYLKENTALGIIIELSRDNPRLLQEAMFYHIENTYSACAPVQEREEEGEKNICVQ